MRPLMIACALVVSSAQPGYSECGPPPPTCALLASAEVIFVGTLTAADGPEYRFRVEERFRGLRRNAATFVDFGIEGSAGFGGVGKRYVVFGDRLDAESDREKTPVIRAKDCGFNMKQLPSGNDLVRQLRAEAGGRSVAPLYGELVAGTEDALNDIYATAIRPLPGIRIRAFDRGGRIVAETTTAADGSYAFKRLAMGDYIITADIPSGRLRKREESQEPRVQVVVGLGECVRLPLVVLTPEP